MNDLFLKFYLAAKSAVAHDKGQSMTEYAMAVGLIALGCVAGEAAIATSVNHTFISIATIIAGGITH